jgi:hypothetical protein
VWPAAACMLLTSANSHSLSIISSAPRLVRFVRVQHGSSVFAVHFAPDRVKIVSTIPGWSCCAIVTG